MTVSPTREARSHGRTHRGSSILRENGPHRPGDGLCSSQPDGSILLDLPDGALSTWFRCIAIDIPGYGKSPKATPELTRWRHGAGVAGKPLTRSSPANRVILVGCSVGSSLVPHMYHLRPSQTAAMIVCGTGVQWAGVGVAQHSAATTNEGIGFRWELHVPGLQPGVQRHAAGDLLRRHCSPSATSSSRPRFHHLPVRGGGPRPTEEFFTSINCPTI